MPLTDEHRAAQAALNRQMSRTVVSYEGLLRKRARRLWGIEENWWHRLLVRLGLRKPRELPIVRIMPDADGLWLALTGEDAERYGGRGLWMTADGRRGLYPDER